MNPYGFLRPWKGTNGMIPTTSELYDLSHTLAAPLLSATRYPWEALDGIKDFVCRLGETLPEDEYDHPAPDIWIAKGVKMAPNVSVSGPCIIGRGTELRPGAFIRGSVLIGEGCVVGNSVELKNAILFDGVQVPHFNYVGDSVLGYKSHLGAGAVTSNVKSDKTPVAVRDGEEKIETGRKKVGAMVGDRTEVGCNSVLCPGSVLGPDAQVYPTSCVRGVLPARHIWKGKDNVVPRREKAEG